MNIDRIETTATFQINEGYWFKVMWGGSIVPGVEDAESETLLLKQRLEDLGKKIGALSNPVSISEALPAIDKRIDAIIQDINACTSVYEKTQLGVQIGLVAFEEVAQSDPRLKAAYDLKLFQLKK